jgi:hypothetical protein
MKNMPPVMPDKEFVKNAIKWISANREEDHGRPLHKLIEEAVFKFDLSPMDMELLSSFFRNNSEKNK